MTLKFYRVASERNVTMLAVASSKDTFTQVDEAAVAARRSLLPAETVIDERGNFVVEFPDSSLGCDSVLVRRRQYRYAGQIVVWRPLGPQSLRSSRPQSSSQVTPSN